MQFPPLLLELTDSAPILALQESVVRTHSQVCG